jgi:hypothetical protein
MKQWYETLFENYGEKYDKEVFTRGQLENATLLKRKSITTRN